MPNQDSDHVRQTLAGSREAYSALIDTYKGMAFAVALNITGNYSDSEDVVQEAFLRAYEKLSSLSDPSKFASWLYTLTKRIALRLLQERHRSALVLADEAALENLQSKADSPAEIYARNELRRILWNEVAELPAHLREVILLYYVQEFTTKRAADFLGISERTARSHLKQARESLRDSVLERVEGELKSRAPSGKMSAAILASLPAIKAPLVLSTSASSAAIKIPLILALAKTKAAVITAAILLAIAGTAILVTHIGRPSPPPGSSAAPAPLAQKDRKQDRGKPKPGQPETDDSEQVLPSASSDILPDILANRSPVWGARVPLAQGADQAYRFILDGKTKPDPLAGSSASAQSQNVLSIPPKPGQSSPRLLPANRGLFSYEGPIQMRLLFLSEWRDSWWGLDEFQPLNDAARKNLREVKADESLSSLRGVVIDAKRIPVARARVRIMEGFDILAVVECDASGRFLIDRLPQRTLSAQAHAWGYQDSQAKQAHVLPEGKSQPLELVLKAAAVVSGTVRDESGKPLACASVAAASPKDSYFGPPTVRTDAQGHYVHSNLPPAKYNLIASHPAFAPATHSGIALVAGKPAQMDFVLNIGATLAGRVVQDVGGKEQGVADVQVQAVGSRKGGAPAWNKPLLLESISGESGAFTIEHIPYGCILKEAIARKGTIEQNQKIEVAVEKNSPPKPLIIKLPAEGRITGRVVDSDEKPIPGVSIYQYELHGPDHTERMPSEPKEKREQYKKAVTDADGGFTVEGIAANSGYVLLAEARGFAPTATDEISGSGTADVLIMLKRGGTLAGRVVMADTKAPVAGARILAKPDRVLGLDPQTQTKLDGTFELANLPEGLWHVGGAINPPDGSIVIEPKTYVKVNDNERTDGLEFTACPALSISGRVLIGGTRQPVASAQITLVRESPESESKPRFSKYYGNSDIGTRYDSKSRADGGFTCKGIAPGTYRISARKDDLPNPSKEKEIVLEKGKSVDNLVIEISQGGSISGVLLDAADRPVSQTKVMAEMEQNPYKYYEYDSSRSRQVSDSQGRFTITNLPLDDEPFRIITAYDDDSVFAASEFVKLTHDKPTAEVIVRVRSRTAISGAVKDDKGKPIRMLTINASLSTPSDLACDRTATTDDEGHYELKDLIAGKYYVYAGKEHFVRQTRIVEPAEDTPLEGVDFVLQPAKFLMGTLVDLNAKKLAGWKVIAQTEDLGNAVKMNIVGEATTDAGGRFEIQGFGEDDIYRLQMDVDPNSAYQSGLRNSNRMCSIWSGFSPVPDKEQVFVVPIGGTIRGRIFYEGTNEPAENVRIDVFAHPAERTSKPRGPECFLTHLDARDLRPVKPNGTFAIFDLPVGRYSMTIRAEKTAEKRIDGVTIDTSLLADMKDIYLPLGCAVSGRLVDATSGKSYVLAQKAQDLAEPGIYIFYRASAGDTYFYVKADYENVAGRFTASGIPTNTRTIYLKATDYPAMRLDVANISPDAPTDLGDVVLRQGETVRGKLMGPNGEPAAHATASISYKIDEGLVLSSTGRADNEGKFSLKGLPVGPASLRSTAGGFENPWAKSNSGGLIDGYKLKVLPDGKTYIETRFPAQTQPTATPGR